MFDYSKDITILPDVRSITMQKGRLYYFEGNFYMPMSLHGGEISRVRRAIRAFMRDNKEMIDNDRSRSSYKTIPELFDEQMKLLELE